jgi:pyruvate dehydrogenase kinase 2/3/4
VGEQVGMWQQFHLRKGENEEDDTPENGAGVGPHPRIGIGLPMSNIFAT